MFGLLILLVKLMGLVENIACDTLETKIKTGIAANEDKFSFVAKVEIDGKHVCSCVILNDNVAITLASCIKGPLSKFSVLIKRGKGGKFSSRKIQQTMTLDKDKNVILIELARGIANKRVLRSRQLISKKSSTCKAVGFSSNGNSLREVEIKTKPLDKCSVTDKKGYFCFDVEKESRLCQTDNGIAIVCKYGKKWQISGLSSVKKGCSWKDLLGVDLSYLRKSMKKAMKLLNTDGLCETPGCYSAAERVLEAMDKNINPCDNFYDFACGKWIKKNSIPQDLSYYGTRRETIETNLLVAKSAFEKRILPGDIEAVVKAKKFYKACMNTDKIEELGNAPIHAFMESMGGLPLLGDAPGGGWDPQAYSLEDLILKAFHMTPYTPMIHLSIKDTEEATARFELGMDQPTISGITTMTNNEVYLKAYKDYLVDNLQALGANASTAAFYANDILNLENDIANSLLLPWEETIDRLTLTQLQENVSTQVNLTKIIEGVYHAGGFSLDRSNNIWIINSGYFSRLDNITNKYSERVIASYIVLSTALSRWTFLPKIYNDIYDKLLKVFGLTPVKEERWSLCVSMLIDRMPYVSGRLFVKEAFLKKEQAYILDLVKQHQKIFKDILDRQSWISKKFKKTLIKKVEEMRFEAGYPKLVTNDRALNKVHKHFTAYVDDPYKTVVSMADAEMIRAAELLKRDFDDNPWVTSPITSNAYYSYKQNAVVILAGVLQPRLYSHDMPEYMNFGGIGYLIGHEISHGFDNNGRLYKDGEVQYELWPFDDDTEYSNRLECLINQFNNYTIPGTGGKKFKHNGFTTSNENVADNGGIKIGYEVTYFEKVAFVTEYQAYRKWVKKTRKGKEENRLPGLPFTPDQMFFLNHAQTQCLIGTNNFKTLWIQSASHSFPRVRITGTLQNSKDFAKAWNCPEGSKMNPVDKCTMFD